MKIFLVLLFLSAVSLINTAKEEGASSSKDSSSNDSSSNDSSSNDSSSTPFSSNPFLSNPSSSNPFLSNPSSSNPSSSSITKVFSHCHCRLGSSRRIVGGEEAEAHLVPWQVSLAHSGSGNHFCGGIIVNGEFILTTAHCVDKKKEDQIKVRVGVHNIEAIPINKIYMVEKIDVPDRTTLGVGDISLLRLKGTINFIPGEVEPACLNFVRKDYTDRLMVSGWGLISRPIRNEFLIKYIVFGKFSPVLKLAYLNPYTENCEEFEICAKSNDDSPCDGDIGGPLHHTENSGITSVEGILSNIYSLKVGSVTTYCTGDAGFSRLSFYKEWFENKIGDNYCINQQTNLKRKSEILDDPNKKMKSIDPNN